MSWSEVQDISHANALLVSKCMADGGREYARAFRNWDSMPTPPDRRYGLWSSSDAENNGYELPDSPESTQLAALEDELGNDWWEAFESCLSEIEQFPIMGFNSAPDMSPVDTGMNESYAGLLASSEYASIRQEWEDCVTSEGVTPDSGAGALVPEFPSSGEEQFRIAAIDVNCKESLGSVQKLADLEAQAQMAYIDEHEGQLTEYRDQVESVLVAAREVLATVGG